MKKKIDGFIHIIIDKYLYQSSEWAFSIRNVEDSKRLISYLYKGFSPGAVIVNNSLMMDDFERSFKALNLNVKVNYLFHPVSSLSLSRRRESISSVGKYFVLHDSPFKIKYLLKKYVTDHKILKSIIHLPFSSDQALPSNINIVALLNIRPPFLSKPKLLDCLKNYNLRLIYYQCFGFLQAPFIKLFSRKKLLNHPSKIDLNSRWKPSTKMAASVGMNLIYLGIDEQSCVEMAHSYKLNAYFINRPTQISSTINEVLVSKARIQVDPSFITNDINNSFKKTLFSILNEIP